MQNKIFKLVKEHKPNINVVFLRQYTNKIVMGKEAAREYQYDRSSGNLHRGWIVNRNKKFKQSAIHRTAATLGHKRTNTNIINKAVSKLKLLNSNKNPQFQRFPEVTQKKIDQRKSIYYAKKHVKAYNEKRKDKANYLERHNKKARWIQSSYIHPLKSSLQRFQSLLLRWNQV